MTIEEVRAILEGKVKTSQLIGGISDSTDAHLWAMSMHALLDCRSKEIAPGIWQHTFTPSKKNFFTEVWNKDAFERHQRRLRKYQRRCAYGLKQHHRAWKPWHSGKGGHASWRHR